MSRINRAKRNVELGLAPQITHPSLSFPSTLPIPPNHLLFWQRLLCPALLPPSPSLNPLRHLTSSPRSILNPSSISVPSIPNFEHIPLESATSPIIPLGLYVTLRDHYLTISRIWTLSTVIAKPPHCQALGNVKIPPYSPSNWRISRKSMVVASPFEFTPAWPHGFQAFLLRLVRRSSWRSTWSRRLSTFQQLEEWNNTFVHQ